MKRSLLFFLLTPSLVAPEAAAQVVAQHAIVVTKLKGSPAAQLIDVDLQTGKFVLQGRFKHDVFPPLAMSVDPVRRDVILAVRVGSISRVVRIGLQGGKVVAESILGDFPGVARVLIVAKAADIYASLLGTNAGVYKLPMNGGKAVLVKAMPRVTAMNPMFWPLSTALLAQSGSTSPKSDPSTLFMDLDSGKIVQGPFVFTGFKPQVLTGIFDVPAALVRQIISTDAGQIFLSLFYKTPTQIAITPQLPKGATRRMRAQGGLQPYVLGGASHPHIKSFTVLGGQQKWNMLAGPLPGDPVDFDLVPLAKASVVFFGKSCSPLAPKGLSFSTTAVPSLGSTNFTMWVFGLQANATALLALGASNQRFMSLPLPLLMPGRCRLHVSVDWIGAFQADNRGSLKLPFPIPNTPSLAGLILYTQWLEPTSRGIAGTQGAALQLYR